MALKLREKLRASWLGRGLAGAVAALACLAGSGCVTSSDFVLGDAKAILGERGEVHFYSQPRDGMRDVQRYRFRWHRDRYAVSLGRSGVSEFTAHPFEGRDLVIQWKGTELWSPKRKLAVRQVSFFLARKIADGAYLLLRIASDDVDPSKRERFCIKSPETPCRISTPEQLFVFARAAAEKDEQDAGLAIIVAPRPAGKKR
jgi:hypothetical protein